MKESRVQNAVITLVNQFSEIRLIERLMAELDEDEELIE